ncbi:hypothetical protein EV182_002779 [Spiromyces aspiralis]|uniref:Uncharacterized protein n=1 Tax=Spiromyces aspiralis TaxID=68401 RepID=A0ACC1HUQ8_9FUNG|nr:hypothetical protein EV182_002779 [Spiromyces aspiralis]
MVFRSYTPPLSAASATCSLRYRAFTSPSLLRIYSSSERKNHKESNNRLPRQQEEEDEAGEEGKERGQNQQQQQQKHHNSEDEPKPTDEYYLSIGRATSIIREELEGFLDHGFHNTSIYHPNIKFREPSYTDLQVKGLSSYLMLCRFIRLSLTTYYTDPVLVVTSLRQLNNNSASRPEDTPQSPLSDIDNGNYKDGNAHHQPSPDIALSVRWIFEGTPRLTHSLSQYEGHFRYKFDRETGLINYHEFVGIFPAPSASFLSKFCWPVTPSSM